MSRSSAVIISVFMGAQPVLTHAADTPLPLAPVIPPQIIIAPTEVRTNPTLAKGCWVRLFPQTGYQGQDELTVAGPVDLPSLRTPTGGVLWKHKAESIIVGPKATITLYENQSYRGPSVTVKPGTMETKLREGLQIMQSIDSLKIRCEE